MNYYIGIDIGGTNLRASILDEEFNIIDKFKIENNVPLGPEANVGALCDEIKERWSNYNPVAVGVASPGPLNLKEGIIINPPNLIGWENFHVKRFIEQSLNLPVKINNDANVAGYSEAKVGAGKGAESVYYITLSTGVGGGFIYKGEIVNGFNSVAAELNNMIINEDTYSHSGLNRGGVEGQCSGVSIARIATERLKKNMTTKDVFERGNAGHPECKEILDQWVLNISKAIANIIVTVDPEVIVLGGSVILHNQEYLKMIREQVRSLVFPGLNVNIKLAEIGDDTGLIGSGILAASISRL